MPNGKEIIVNRIFTAALAGVVCLFSLSHVASADTLKFVSDSGVNVGGEDVYPYQFQINGSSTLTSLMCLDLNRTVSFGESWNVSATSIALDSSLTSQKYRADALLFYASTLGQYSNADLQWAAWSIFDPSGVSGNAAFDTTAQNLASEAMQYANNAQLINSGFFSGFTLYQPTNDKTGWTNGIPQEFIGAAQTPEPSSLLLMGSGLASFAGVVRRRLRS